MQTRQREGQLRLHSQHPHDTEVTGNFDDMFQHRRLSGAGLAADHQHLAQPTANLAEQVGERLLLREAIEQQPMWHATALGRLG